MPSFPYSGGSNASDVPWVEKYRPVNFKDFVGNEDAVSELEVIANHDYWESDMPNLILSGPSGSGKTSSVLAIAHKIFGLNYEDLVLEIDASDDRGIDVVIHEIRMFAQKNLRLCPGRYRTVILRKADSMTYGAQKVLSKIMEIYSNSTRFALVCDTSSEMVDIIESIQSRCTHIQFSKLWNHLMEVLLEEKVRFDLEVEGGLQALISMADGDMRLAVNTLQATYIGFRFVNRDNVFEAYLQLQSLNVESMTCDVTESNSDDDYLESQNGSSVAASEVEKRSSQKRGAENCENGRDKRLCLDNSSGSAPRSLSGSYPPPHQAQLRKERDEANERATKLANEKEELQNMIKDWKVRFADAEVKRKETRKQLKLVEKEKAGLQQKVAELEKALAEQPPVLPPPPQ